MVSGLCTLPYRWRGIVIGVGVDEFKMGGKISGFISHCMVVLLYSRSSLLGVEISREMTPRKPTLRIKEKGPLMKSGGESERVTQDSLYPDTL